jgi:3-hydroxybutyryl-CoA dehydrogenase
MDVMVVGTSPAADDVIRACERTGVPAARLTVASERLAEAPLVIEASSGAADDKLRLLSAMSPLVGEDAVVVTTTRTIPVTDLSPSAHDPSRFLGLRLVAGTTFAEIVRALPTGAAAVERVASFMAAIGYDTVTVRDRPGLLVDRLALPYLNQAITELDAGIGDLDDIDRAMRLGLGYPAGPFEVLDRDGLREHLEATTAVFQETGAQEFAPPPLLRRMVAAGRLGSEHGEGFHRYEEGSQ